MHREAPQRLNALKRLVLGALIGGIKRAERLGIDALCRNGVARLWNLHMHILQSKQYDCLLEEVVGALEQGRDVLERINSKDALLGAQLLRTHRAVLCPTRQEGPRCFFMRPGGVGLRSGITAHRQEFGRAPCFTQGRGAFTTVARRAFVAAFKYWRELKELVSMI